ncbi:Uncharacterised protein [Mycobacteroides abscessus]|nr:Uncharacterised protein [Mycobacteroides abscessus]
MMYHNFNILFDYDWHLICRKNTFDERDRL